MVVLFDNWVCQKSLHLPVFIDLNFLPNIGIKEVVCNTDPDYIGWFEIFGIYFASETVFPLYSFTLLVCGEGDNKTLVRGGFKGLPEEGGYNEGSTPQCVHSKNSERKIFLDNRVAFGIVDPESLTIRINNSDLKVYPYVIFKVICKNIYFDSSWCIGLNIYRMLTLEETIILPLYMSRYWSMGEMRRRAFNKVYAARKEKVTPKHLILVPNVKDVWGLSKRSKLPLDKHECAEQVADRVTPHPGRHPTYRGRQTRQDADHMAAWLENVTHESLVADPGHLEYEKVFPCAAPLADFLLLDCEREDSYVLPSLDVVRKWVSTRSITADWASKVHVKEFIVGHSTEEEFHSFRADFFRRHCRDQNELPTGVLSLDVEDVKAQVHDLYRMRTRVGEWLTLNGSDNEPIYSDDDDSERGFGFPGKIMYGGSD
jgi:hypothetical protein